MNTVDVHTDPLARRVAEGLRKVSIIIRSRAWKEAGIRGITPLQGQTLEFLRRQAGHAATISTLASELAVSLPTISDMVRTLEKKGLVQKSRSLQDARIVAVRLSARGKRMAGGTRGRRDFLEGAAAQLTISEQEVLLQNLLKILRTLQAKDAGPATRIGKQRKPRLTKRRLS